MPRFLITILFLKGYLFSLYKFFIVLLKGVYPPTPQKNEGFLSSGYWYVMLLSGFNTDGKWMEVDGNGPLGIN